MNRVALLITFVLLAGCTEKTCDRLLVTTVDGRNETYGSRVPSTKVLVRYRRSGDSVTIWEDMYSNGGKMFLTDKTSIEGVSIVRCEHERQRHY